MTEELAEQLLVEIGNVKGQLGEAIGLVKQYIVSTDRRCKNLEEDQAELKKKSLPSASLLGSLSRGRFPWFF